MSDSDDLFRDAFMLLLKITQNDQSVAAVIRDSSCLLSYE
jgi:hypothetical protein